jgi:POT family proton-dependent oligopeptide transporter
MSARSPDADVAASLSDEAKHGYRTTPEPTTKMPSGIPYIVGNEAAERFSYYGMRAILPVFMMRYLLNRQGELAPMSETDATYYCHLFFSAVYFLPLLGGFLADRFLGKYKTIIQLSLVYCAGHIVLSFNDTRTGLLIGLSLIALGAGGIKPCVSAHVGDQFGEQNKHLLPKIYNWFYFSINFGAFYSTLLTPAILERQGHFARWIPEEYAAKVAFGVPGALMLLATFVFWLGRRKFAHIPPRGEAFFRDIITPDGVAAVKRLAVFYLFVAVFWCLYDQNATSWVAQAERMDRNSPLIATAIKYVSLGLVAPPDVIASAQPQAINPFLIMVLIPLFQFALYPAINKVFPLTPLRKVGIGFVLTMLSFVIVAGIERELQAGVHVHIGWQFFAFFILTAGEVMVSITALEYSYAQAPPAMKSVIMSLNLLSVTVGNLLVAAVTGLIGIPFVAERLNGANYFLFFAGLMGVATIIYVFVSSRMQERTYIQGETEATAV